MAVRKDRDQQADVGGRLSGMASGGGSGGKKNSSGGGAGISALTKTATSQNALARNLLDRDQQLDVGGRLAGTPPGQGGKTSASNGGRPTQMGPEGVADPSPSPAAPSATTTSQPAFAPNGRPLTDGTIQTYDDPSRGQVVSALTRMPMSPFGVVSTLASVADSDKYGRDMIGRAVDEENGGTPDPGYQGPNHIASSTNSRGDTRAVDDTRLMDRAATTARDELGGTTGDVTTGGDDGGAEFSSVKLADRRRPYDDLSAVDLLRGLL